jgi:hypothetical protein
VAGGPPWESDVPRTIGPAKQQKIAVVTANGDPRRRIHIEKINGPFLFEFNGSPPNTAPVSSWRSKGAD